MTDESSSVTWVGMLAQWTRFAQASVALPGDATGARWRAAAAPIIGLHAVTFALADLGKLTGAGERELALERAEFIISKNTAVLYSLWPGEAVTEEVAKLIGDAEGALRAAKG